jgi:peroxin-3
MLFLLTTSQLSILARRRYLEDIKGALPVVPISSSPLNRLKSESSVRQSARHKNVSGGLFGYFSISSMGLDEYEDPSASTASQGSLLSFIPGRIARFAGLTGNSRHAEVEPTDSDMEEDIEETPEEQSDAERVFLTYSWWLLHEGWKGVGERVNQAVSEVFGR